MHTDTTPKEMSAGDGNSKAGHTYHQTVSNAESTDKMFAKQALRFALAGNTLASIKPADGAAMYNAVRWGLSRALPDLQAASHFLAVIGGAT